MSEKYGKIMKQVNQYIQGIELFFQVFETVQSI
jgi:hypothetical protein